jgi:hypothetical protein
MANYRYFADLENGVTLEFSRVDYRGKEGSFGYDKESGKWVKANRKVEYKAFASKHECDARCMNATGKIMRCECACGGKNHGRGAFVCEAA